MSDYKYRFSVVIPIYNVEKYLDETITSVVNQDIGLEHIQIILVNDGSPDASEDICLHWRDKYPDNIVYVKQKNGGVSRARNHGLEFVEGKYVNFLDADDKWSPDAFSHVWDFFEKRENRIDLVACPQKFFEAREDNHPLYFKFIEGERIIDILDKYDYVQLHITASFIKSEVAKKYQFDEKLKYSEDAKYVGEIILDRLCYGVTNQATHYYRKRLDESSAVQNKMKNKDWYLVTPRRYSEYLMQKSIEKYGFVIPYIQYTFMYDMQYRVREKNEEYLTEAEMKEYHEILHELLQCVDDDIICKPDKIFSEHRIKILSMKYGFDIRTKMVYRDHWLTFHNLKIFHFNSRSMFVLTGGSVETEGEGQLHLSGYLWTPFIDMSEFFFVSGSEKVRIDSNPADFKGAVCFHETVIRPYVFEMDLPLKKYEVQMLYDKLYTENVYVAVEKDKKTEVSNEVKKYLNLEILPVPYVNYELKNAESSVETVLSDIPAKDFLYRGGKLLYENEPVFSMKEKGNLILEEIIVKTDVVTVAGKIRIPVAKEDMEFYAVDAKNERLPFSLSGEDFKLEIPVADKMRSIRMMYRFRKLFKGRLSVEDYLGKASFIIGNRRFELESNILKIYPMSKKEQLLSKLGIRKGK